jgi:hypothetical protein
MTWVGFESTIPAFERAKTVHALHRRPLWSARWMYAELKRQLISKQYTKCPVISWDLLCSVFLGSVNNSVLITGVLALLHPVARRRKHCSFGLSSTSVIVETGPVHNWLASNLTLHKSNPCNSVITSSAKYVSYKLIWMLHEHILMWLTLRFQIKGYVTPITVSARSKARNAFARSNTGFMGQNPTRGMDVCMSVLSCAGRGLAMGRSPVQVVLLTLYKIDNFIINYF